MIKYYAKKKRFNMVKSGRVEERYIATPQPQDRLTTETICNRVAMASTLSPHEVELAINEIEDVILAEMANGRPIQLGRLGTLMLKMEATSCESKEEVTSKTIKKMSYYFKPNMIVGKLLATAELRKIELVKAIK